MRDKDLNALLLDPKIVRNRLKIFSVRNNANVFIKIQNEFRSFKNYIWNFVNNKPIKGDHEALEVFSSTSIISYRISKDLKKRGMNFVGPTIIYAYMQGVGLINDHIKTCWKYKSS